MLVPSGLVSKSIKAGGSGRVSLPVERETSLARATGASTYPRPSNGMAVALIVIVKTLVSSGRLAM